MSSCIESTIWFGSCHHTCARATPSSSCRHRPPDERYSCTDSTNRFMLSRHTRHEEKARAARLCRHSLGTRQAQDIRSAPQHPCLRSQASSQAARRHFLLHGLCTNWIMPSYSVCTGYTICIMLTPPRTWCCTNPPLSFPSPAVMASLLGPRLGR